MQNISPNEANALLDAQDAILLDIRSEQEFNECHLPGAVLVPNGKIDERLAEILGDKNTIFYCTSGARTDKAAQKISNAGFKKAETILGGMNAWVQNGLPTVTTSEKRVPMTIQRQVQLTLGIIILALAFLVLSGTQTPIYFIAAIGAGLAFAGLTGSCALAKILLSMPWNRAG